MWDKDISILLTKLLTYNEQSLSWDAKCSSAVQESPTILCNTKVNFRYIIVGVICTNHTKSTYNEEENMFLCSSALMHILQHVYMFFSASVCSSERLYVPQKVCMFFRTYFLQNVFISCRTFVCPSESLYGFRNVFSSGRLHFLQNVCMSFRESVFLQKSVFTSEWLCSSACLRPRRIAIIFCIRKLYFLVNLTVFHIDFKITAFFIWRSNQILSNLNKTTQIYVT
jgi:hypothetical protein